MEYIFFLHILDQKREWYKGTANAIYQNIPFIQQFEPEYVLVLSGDHIYKMNYNDMIKYHKEVGAAATIAVMSVPWEQAGRFGIMNTDESGRITEFEEKPDEPISNQASMGIYVFNWDKLREYLILDEQDPTSSNDFGKMLYLECLNVKKNCMHINLMGIGRT